jgi:S-formylglutathione hydrolase FrmB
MTTHPITLASCLALGALACAEPKASRSRSEVPVTATEAPAPVAVASMAESTAPSAAPNPPAGSAPSRVETRAFASAALGVEKRYVVYLPRGYDDSQHRFPVIYLLHGLGGNETNWTQQGHLREAADGVALAALVVMPDGDDGFYVNSPAPVDYEACLRQKPPWDPGEPPATYCVRAPRYEDSIAIDLVADVDKAYRTQKARRSRGIGGLSMGGFGALSLAMRHPDVFSAAASHSGMAALLYRGPHPYAHDRAAVADAPAGWGGQYTKKFREHVQRIFGPDIEAWRAHDPAVLALRVDPSALAIYLDCGRSDEFQFEDHASYLHNLLGGRGVANEITLIPGGHNWQVWSAMLPAGLRFFAAHLAP